MNCNLVFSVDWSQSDLIQTIVLFWRPFKKSRLYSPVHSVSRYEQWYRKIILLKYTKESYMVAVKVRLYTVCESPDPKAQTLGESVTVQITRFWRNDYYSIKRENYKGAIRAQLYTK
jgi:hypothetical protein